MPDCWQKIGGGHTEMFTYKQGAPAGGPGNSFPPGLLRTFVWRFTNMGDAVLGVGLERTQLLEIALQGGRPIELFLSDASLSGEVHDREEKTFHKAFSSGLFKHDIGGAVYVGPGLLPSKLPADTTPPALRTPAAGTSAEEVMKTAAQPFGYTVEFSSLDQVNRLHVIAKQGQEVAYPDT
ncbi:unnamed protein product, partial [Sphacelaria rigidula]